MPPEGKQGNEYTGMRPGKRRCGACLRTDDVRNEYTGMRPGERVRHIPPDEGREKRGAFGRAFKNVTRNGSIVT